MIESDRLVATQKKNPESKKDWAIRPRTFKEYCGQTQVVEQMTISIKAALGRKECLDHTLLLGPPGLGKTTMANIIANEMGAQITSTSGPA
ncbi:MAG: AAA family ATPase, partial [Gammaproteobacteria bacterium]|nr:AAA family ATPase [Gammaproteobacteria bacterium]